MCHLQQELLLPRSHGEGGGVGSVHQAEFYLLVR